MNKQFPRFTFFLLMYLTLPLTARAQVVNIPDPNLRAKIESALGKASGAPITAADMATLTELNARDASISDLTGLEFATNLTTLRLHNNHITNISALSSLIELRGLFLDNNDIGDISPLSGLIQLEGLGLGGNRISDISPLLSLTELTALRLNRNNIIDLSPLVANTGLGSGDEVNVRQNRLSDQSLFTDIPTLQSRGVTVEFDPPAPPAPFENIPFDINNIPEPIPLPKEVRDFFELDPFYRQWISVEGFPVVASAKVSPYALKEAAWLIWHMTRHRPEVLKVMAQNRIRVSIIAHDEMTSDLPEFDEHLGPPFFRDVRGRGINCPIGCGTMAADELSVLRSNAYSVLIHEFAHVIHRVLEVLTNTVAPEFDNRLKTTYNAAMEKELWPETYAASNRHEYWAEGVQVWFHGTQRYTVNTRAALKNYDPGLATLIAEVFGDSDWRFTPAGIRTHLPHLQGFDPQAVPQTKWPPGVLEAYEELRNPAINERNEWVNLPLYDPSLIPILNKSRTGGIHTNILFVNLSGAEVLLYWVFPDGTEHFEYRFEPRPDLITRFGCRVGDLLLAKDSTGNNLGVFQAVEKVGRALIGPALILITPGLSKISGDNQAGVSGAVLGKPFVVEVRDESLSTLEGISVTFTVTAGGGTLNTTITRTNTNGRAQSTLTLGPNLGANTVEVSATGIEVPATFHAVSDTEAPSIAADVNNDGSVNILDLVVIASEFGNTGTDLVVDVNRDGVISILDLVLVAGMFDSVAAVPSVQPQVPETLMAVEVQGWLTDARALEVRDSIIKRGFLVLEQLLVSLTPKETELLPNYPNPFNPETWIPYRLAEDAFVMLTIYDSSGQVIRTLEVGHQIASAYENRSKAIYWDGRNDVGEQGASGIYFYQLWVENSRSETEAGDYSATRKMVILK